MLSFRYTDINFDLNTCASSPPTPTIRHATSIHPDTPHFASPSQFEFNRPLPFRFSSETLYTSPSSLIRPEEHQRTFASRQVHSIRHTSRAASKFDNRGLFSLFRTSPYPIFQHKLQPSARQSHDVRARPFPSNKDSFFFSFFFSLLSFCPFVEQTIGSPF